MPILVFGEQTSNFQPAPTGLHPAICCSLIDLGTQTYKFKDQETTGRYFIAKWELLIDEKQANGQAFTVSKKWKFSGNEKANMRKDLEAWRGKKFTNEEMKTWDIANIVGARCMLNVTHAPSADGSTTYANIASIAPMMKGLTPLAPTLDPQLFLMSDPKYFKPDLLESLSDNLRVRIKSSPEYERIVSGKGATGAAERPPVKEEELNDEIPF